MRRWVSLLFTFLPVLTFANMGPDGFHAFKQRVFVETGTFLGSGIRLALEAGFEEVHSIEINRNAAALARRQFKKNPHVHIWCGDSGLILSDVLEDIHEPVTFWLDGHRGDPDPNGGKNTPLMEELEQIKHHPIKSHIILIDDLHCCETILFDFLTLDEIIEKVKEINPEYIITFVDGGDQGEYPNNILVALPPPSE